MSRRCIELDCKRDRSGEFSRCEAHLLALLRRLGWWSA